MAAPGLIQNSRSRWQGVPGPVAVPVSLLQPLLGHGDPSEGAHNVQLFQEPLFTQSRAAALGSVMIPHTYGSSKCFSGCK